MDSVCGTEMPQYEQLSKLTYMQMCLKVQSRVRCPLGVWMGRPKDEETDGCVLGR